MRATPGWGAEASHLDEPIATEETRRGIDARWSLDRERGRLQASLGVLTAGDQLARSTALGYVAAAMITLGPEASEVACNLHDGACSGGVAGALAVGIQLHGVLGDSVGSLDPAAQSHYLAQVVTLPLTASAMLHAQLALGLLDLEVLGQVLLAWEL